MFVQNLDLFTACVAAPAIFSVVYLFRLIKELLTVRRRFDIRSPAAAARCDARWTDIARLEAVRLCDLQRTVCALRGIPK